MYYSVLLLYLSNDFLWTQLVKIFWYELICTAEIFKMADNLGEDWWKEGIYDVLLYILRK